MRPQFAILVLLALSACAGPAAAPLPTPTPLPQVWLSHALDDLTRLQRFHFEVTIDANDPMLDAFMSGTSYSGEFVAPDRALVRSQGALSISRANTVELRAGGQIYIPSAGDTWIEDTNTVGGTGFNTTREPDFVRNHMTLVLRSATVATDAGFEDVYLPAEDQATPVVVHANHITFQVDPTRWEASGGLARLGPVPGGSVWIDPSTGHVVEMTIDLDMGSVQATLTAGRRQTPTPRTAPTPPLSIITFVIHLTRQDDPTIAVPMP